MKELKNDTDFLNYTYCMIFFIKKSNNPYYRILIEGALAYHYDSCKDTKCFC